MRVVCDGLARLPTRVTGAIYEVSQEELDWDAVGSDERDMGPEIHHEAIIDHPDLGQLTWSLWEYPEGFQSSKETDVGGHQIIEDFNYRLEHEPDIWVDYDPPDDPLTIFMDSYHSTSDLLENYGTDHGADLINRMIFSQHIAALEAYLGDTLIKAVLSDRDAKQRLMSRDTELLKARFSLVEIAQESDLVDRRIREYLRSILFHNLAKVDFLYDTALGITILNLVSDKARLFEVIQFRHDCVHRNGADKDGNKLTVFTKQYVQTIADLIKHFVEKIEVALRAKLPF